MLKLIKYEMIHSYRSFGLVFGIFLLACILIPFIPYKISLILGPILSFAAFAIIISVMVTIIKNYNTSMFKNPGYLTLTLPVSTHKLVISKVISATIWFGTSMTVLALGMFILALGICASEGLTIEWNSIFEAINYALKYVDWYGFTISIISTVISALSGTMGLFALCTILQTKYTRNHKVLIGLVIYFEYSMFGALIINQVSSSVSLTANNHIFGVAQEVWLYLLVSLVSLAISYLVTVYVINNKIEIE